MSFSALFANIQWIPVIITTVLSFVIGFVWHSPYLFGKTWKSLTFPKGGPSKLNAPLIFGGTAILHIMALSSLSALVSRQGGVNGLIVGSVISFVWVLPAMGGTYLFANRSLKLLAIDAGMYLVLFSVSGFILGAW